MMLRVALALALARIISAVPPLTVVSAANGRYALKELAVLLEIKVRSKGRSANSIHTSKRRTARRARASMCG